MRDRLNIAIKRVEARDAVVAEYRRQRDRAVFAEVLRLTAATPVTTLEGAAAVVTPQ